MSDIRLNLNGKACCGSGNVLLIRHPEKANGLAVLRTMSTEEVDYERIKREVWFLRWLSHPNLAEVYQIFSIASDVYILSSFYDLGSVLHNLRASYSCGLPEKAIAQVVKNVLLAVKYLHEQKIVHRAIRCAHILLNSNGTVKLSGLHHCLFLQKNELTGVDKVLHDFDAETEDGLLWTAPEVLKQDLFGYDLLSDVYSVGITICEMANGFPPFSDMDNLQMLLEKNKGTTPRLLDCTTLTECDVNLDADQMRRRGRKFSDSLHQITDNCLKPSPENRWSVSKLLTHPFVRSVKKNRPFSSLLPHASLIEPSKLAALPPQQMHDATGEDAWLF